MNLHINGIETRTVELKVEYVRPTTPKGRLSIDDMRRGKYRAMIKGDRAALNRVFKSQPNKLVLERASTDPSLADAFGPVIDVRVRGHKFRIYRHDHRRNKIWMRRANDGR